MGSHSERGSKGQSNKRAATNIKSGGQFGSEQKKQTRHRRGGERERLRLKAILWKRGLTSTWMDGRRTASDAIKTGPEAGGDRRVVACCHSCLVQLSLPEMVNSPLTNADRLGRQSLGAVFKRAQGELRGHLPGHPKSTTSHFTEPGLCRF